MKTALFAALVVLGAFLTVALSEGAIVYWLQIAPFDVTGSYFLRAVIPAHLLVVGAAYTALFAVFRHKPWVFMILYAVVAGALLTAMLAQFFNPAADILRYNASLLFAQAVWFGIWRERILNPAA